jgi:glycosyltransferase involved in cell wall biosynthesis
MTLLVLSTHPVQYHAPVYRALQAHFGIPTTVIYASDFSVAGYHDRDFGTSLAWDTDLLSGYDARFLSRVRDGGATNDAEVSAKGIGKLIRQINPEVILVQGYRPRFDLRAFASAWHTRKPLLFRAETLDIGQAQSTPWKRLVRDLFLRAFYGQMNRLLYIGQNSRSHYLRLGVPESRLIFSPYCVDTSSFETEDDARQRLRVPTREHLQISADRFVILVSGKLIPRKSPDLLLEAIKRLPPELRSIITVLFLGAGEMSDLLAQQAQTAPEVDVRMAGFQNQSKLSAFYHAADMMVLASQLEPWGLVVNEALHHGLPCVVSSHVGSSPDLIMHGTTGYEFESGNPEALADALRKGYELSQDSDTRSRCRQLVQRYSVRVAAQGIASAYQEVK